MLQSFWERVLYEQKYDLIVVGAGLTGQSTALFFKYKYPDARVLVADRGFYPIGASTRNAGFACFGTVGEHLADLEIETEEVVKQRILRRYKGLQLLRETLGEDTIDYEHTGGVEIFTDTAAFSVARDHVPKFNAWLYDLTGEEEVYKAHSYLGIPAIYNREEGMLHPGKLIKELYRQNVELGIEYRWNTIINELDLENGVVFTENHEKLLGEHIVIATNAFTEKLLPGKNITPGRGYVFVTGEMSMLEWMGTFHYNKGYIYFRNVGDDRLLIGGARDVDYQTEETDEFGVNDTIKKYLVNFSNEVLELPQGWTIEQEWSGIMGFTETKSPYLEKVGKRTVLVAGLSGMGVALGMQLGKEAANTI